MSRISKICFLITGLSLAIMLAVRYVLGGWIYELWFALGIGLVAFVIALVFDFKFYLEFFRMRTTKHGMNMGTMILLTLVLIVTVNYLSVQKNKTWDVTEDKLFSLSQQSLDVIKGLKSPIDFVIFYNGAPGRDEMQAVRESLRLFQDVSPQMTVNFYDSYVENQMAQKYLNDVSDRGSAGTKIYVFVEYEGKRERVATPFNESEVTSALVKVTRKVTKKIYFLTGHGERDINGVNEEGLKALKDEMERYAAKVETLSLLSGIKIPEDATAIVIAGPTTALLDSELAALKDYAQNGGHLFVMADPGQKHNLAQFIKVMGIDFSNTYVTNGGIQVQNVSPLSPVGLAFDTTSEITKPFMTGSTYTLFHLASEVRGSPDAPKSLQFSDLVKTGDRGISLSEISQTAKQGEMRAYTLGVSVKGTLPSAAAVQPNGTASPAKEFAAVVFGDSDFVSNKLLGNGNNKDLAMNAIAFLTGEKDLISIRPKQAKGTKMEMTRATQLGAIGFAVLLPVFLFVMGSVVWFRRRGT